MFKIVRGCGIVEKGTPYLFVSVHQWSEKIYLERFILIGASDKNAETVTLGLRTKISSITRVLPNDPKLDLAKLLNEEIQLAKTHYSSWLFEQIGERSFAQVRNILWDEIIDIEPFVLMGYKFEQRDLKKIKTIAESSNCEELTAFLNKFLYLRLTIEEESSK